MHRAAQAGCLKEDGAYFDMKHDRCRGFKTLKLWVYYPNFRMLLCLGKMEIENEEINESMSTFWNSFNEMLRNIVSVSPPGGLYVKTRY